MKPILFASTLLLVPAGLAAQTSPPKGITWSASTPTRVSPAEAATILAGNQSIANRTGLGVYPTEGPLVVSTGSDPTAGPYGAFVPFYLSLPDRRLDGSLYSDFPWMAGSPYGGWESSFSGAPYASGFVSGDGFSQLRLRGSHHMRSQAGARNQRPLPPAGRIGPGSPVTLPRVTTPSPSAISSVGHSRPTRRP